MGMKHEHGVRLGLGTIVMMYVKVTYTSSPVYHEADRFEIQSLLPPGKLTILPGRLRPKQGHS
jgi:hypothetical protein